MSKILSLVLLFGSCIVSASNTITFEANEGSGRIDAKIVKSTPRYVKLPTCRYVREGYRFVGWCGLGEDCDEEFSCYHKAGETVLITRDTTYRAMWKRLWISHATNYCAYVADGTGHMVAVMLVKAAKPKAKTGESMITATVFPAQGRKFSLRGTTDSGLITLSSGATTFELSLSETELRGTANEFEVLGAPVDPNWGKPGMPLPYSPWQAFPPAVSPIWQTMTPLGKEYVFRAYDSSIPLCDDCWLCLPEDVQVLITGTSWKTPAKDKLKLVGGVPVSCDSWSNPCGLKLSYNSQTGKFTGSFYAYRNIGSQVGLYIKDKHTVVGVLVDGVGHGFAVSKAGNVCEVDLKNR